MTDWHAYFQEYRRQRIAADAPDDGDEEPDPEPVVTTPGYIIPDPLKAPGKVGTIARRLAAQQWEVQVMASVAMMPAKLWKTDAEDGSRRKGDVRTPSHEIAFYSLAASKRAGGKSLAVLASFEHRIGKTAGPSFVSATTHDPILGRVWRISDTKPRPQRAWEKEDDIPAPIGLGQWLDIVCPKPAPKPRKKKEEA